MIDLHALDKFAKDHLEFEAKCSRCYQNPSFSTPLTDAEVFCSLDRIRALVMDGAIDDACSICEKLCLHAIEDPRIQLNVRIHKFYELLHVAGNVPREQPQVYMKALQNALECSQQLAGYALDAFPEAYGLFTESMVLFAYPERTCTHEAIRALRSKLADDLVALIRMTVYARESHLSFAVRYLLLIYLQFKAPVVSPGEALGPMERLVRNLVECNEDYAGTTSRITWKTDSSRPTKFNHRGEYKESVIQTLPERVNISRQDAIESLSFTSGDVLAALKNELGRVLISRQHLRVLVAEYCAARGIHTFETLKSAPTYGTHAQFSSLSDDQKRIIVPSHLIGKSAQDMFPDMYKLRTLAEKNDLDAFLEAVQHIEHDILTSSPALSFRIGQSQVLRLIQKGEYDSAVQVSQDKLGPLAQDHPEFLASLSDTTTLLVYAAEVKNIKAMSMHTASTSRRIGGGAGTENPGTSARAGDKRIRHTRLPTTPVSSESLSERSDGDNTPFEDFFNTAYRAVVDHASLDAIVTEAYKAYEKRGEEPRLVRLLKTLLLAHEEWQTQNMMKDNFLGFLGVDEITGDSRAGCKSVLEGTSGTALQMDDPGGLTGHSERCDDSRASDGDRNRRREAQREQTILTLMEFLAMSRAEALAVVRNHPHAENPQAILESLLGTTM